MTELLQPVVAASPDGAWPSVPVPVSLTPLTAAEPEPTFSPLPRFGAVAAPPAPMAPADRHLVGATIEAPPLDAMPLAPPLDQAPPPAAPPRDATPVHATTIDAPPLDAIPLAPPLDQAPPPAAPPRPDPPVPPPAPAPPTAPPDGFPTPPLVAAPSPPRWAPAPTAEGGYEAALAPAEAGATMTLTEEETPSPRADDRPPGPASRSSMRNSVEWVLIIGAALVAAVVIKTYLLQAFYIPSPSMQPTLNIQDRVLVNKLSYRLHDVHRGDVVVFERPPNDLGEIRDLIKRVIALPGETVEGKDNTVYVDGRALREPYLPRDSVTGQFGPKTIPPGYVWVMGDNRSNSSDSRVFGAISQERIVGRAFVRVWPISAFGLL